MKTLLLTALSFAMLCGLSAQNMVPNPSFESINTAPCSWLVNPSDMPAAVDNWTMPSNGSTDIFTNYVATSCFAHNLSTNSSAPGQQTPRTGNAQSALLTYGAGCGSMPNYREYLQVQLTSPMVVGTQYDFEFWLSMADYSNRATNNFGIYFSTTNVFQSTCFVLPYTPQFNSTTIISNKTGWTRVNGTITATAAWSRIVIGNFFSNAATATTSVSGSQANSRYYIDDVSLTPSLVLPSATLALTGARNSDGSVELQWQGLDNPPADGYLLQKSAYGDVWETVAEPQGAQAAWTDAFAPQSGLMYRLRYVGEDGQLFTSATVVIPAADGLRHRFYLAGNPVSLSSASGCAIRVANADATPAFVTITDLNGHQAWRSETMPLTEWDNASLPVEGLRPAIYLVQMHMTDGVTTRKMIVTD